MRKPSLISLNDDGCPSCHGEGICDTDKNLTGEHDIFDNHSLAVLYQ